MKNGIRKFRSYYFTQLHLMNGFFLSFTSVAEGEKIIMGVKISSIHEVRLFRNAFTFAMTFFHHIQIRINSDKELHSVPGVFQKMGQRPRAEPSTVSQ
jgi:hypothetical protein